MWSTTPRTRSIIVDDIDRPAVGPGPRPVQDRGAHHRGRRGRRRAAWATRSPTTTSSAPRSRVTTGPSSTNARPRPMCYTSAAPPGIPRASSTATVRRCCTPWPVPRHHRWASARATGCWPIVPMFHANAWGTPYAAFFGRGGPDLARAVSAGRAAGRHHRRAAPDPVAGCAHHLERPAALLPRPTTSTCRSLRMLTAGGAAVPRQLIEAFEERFGIDMIQGWGMTETSPVCAFGRPPRGVPRGGDGLAGQDGPGHPGVEIRMVDDEGTVLPNDGESVGEFEVRGPGSPARTTGTPRPDRFHDGWLRTGDVGTLDAGLHADLDRTKDVIKSGRRVDLLGRARERGHGPPRRLRGGRHRRSRRPWDERPLVAVIVGERGRPRAGRAPRVPLPTGSARWWLPERWAFVDEIPKTWVGKFDKKVLRTKARRRRPRGRRGHVPSTR